MEYKLTYTENYLLIVDNSQKINIDDWCLDFDLKRIYKSKTNENGYIFNKIIAHLPLNNSPILEGVDLLPPIEDDLSEFLLQEEFKGSNVNPRAIGYWIDGYNKAKEKYKYTDKDLRKAMKYASEITNNKLHYMDKYIQSLQQPKIPIIFDVLDQWYNPKTNRAAYSLPEITGLNDDDGCYMAHSVTTNSEGQTVWVGNYKY